MEDRDVYSYKISQVWHEVILSVYYEDGELYHTTKDYYEISAFLKTVNVPSSGEQLISVVEGTCTNVDIVNWYKRHQEMIS